MENEFSRSRQSVKGSMCVCASVEGEKERRQSPDSESRTDIQPVCVCVWDQVTPLALSSG